MLSRSSRAFSAIAAKSSRTVPQSTKSKEVFVFDFDGVVADSCDECTETSLRCLRSLFPKGKQTPLPPAPAALASEMRELRPFIETGWEIPVVLRLRLEAAAGVKEAPSSVSDILAADLRGLVDGSLERWGTSEAQFIDGFGGARDAWIAADEASWIEATPFYPGVPQTLIDRAAASATSPSSVPPADLHILTTKQKRFAVALTRAAGVGAEVVPEDRVYGLGEYKSKADVLAKLRVELASEHAESGIVHFFEDRWPTLAKCAADRRLTESTESSPPVKLYLCAWGYCTPDDVASAHAEPLVEVIDRESFAEIVAGQKQS